MQLGLRGVTKVVVYSLLDPNLLVLRRFGPSKLERGREGVRERGREGTYL